ncbi:MAG: HAD-IB family phosphatase, partial [Candidatus Diapherotrites archaeon]|nr:HAD-IB family phosphatase [Candidatus Diapherotrites archaeon]
AKNMGKGKAILTGIREAKNSVLVFMDADFRNASGQAVEELAFPILSNKAKLCKASFGRASGRVTELTAKPLLKLIFPETELRQPLSGQFAARKEFLNTLEISTGWGADVGIVLDSIKKEEKVIETDIGALEHKHRSLQQLSETASEVTKTILQNAGFFSKKHKIIIFDFDRTLVKGSSIDLISKKLGFGKALGQERKKYNAGEISERELTKRIARMFSGIPEEKMAEAASEIPKQHFANETIIYLKRMGYKIAVVSFAFRQAIEGCFHPKLFDAIVSPALEVEGRAFTGKAVIPKPVSEKHVFSKGAAVKSLLKRFGAKSGEAIAVGDSPADNEMFKQVGVAVAINPKKAAPAAVRIKSIPEIIIIAE